MNRGEDTFCNAIKTREDRLAQSVSTRDFPLYEKRVLDFQAVKRFFYYKSDFSKSQLAVRVFSEFILASIPKDSFSRDARVAFRVTIFTKNTLSGIFDTKRPTINATFRNQIARTRFFGDDHPPHRDAGVAAKRRGVRHGLWDSCVSA